MRTLIKALLFGFLVINLSYALPVSAQDGALDATFDPGTGANHSVIGLAPLPDGTTLIGGNFTTYNGTARSGIARLNANGTLDTSFDPGMGVDGTVYAVALQADGKAVIVGDFTIYNGEARNGIARVNSNGTLDTSFNPGAGTDGAVYAVALQADGKIVIGGDFATYDGTARNRVARVNANGTLDVSFDPGAGPDDFVYDIVVQPDGRILIGGRFFTYDGLDRRRLARLNAGGGLDADFDTSDGPNQVVYNIALQPDGRIVIVGGFSAYGGVDRASIARVNADGTLDTTFDPGTGASGLLYALALQTNGRLLIGGNLLSYDGVSRVGLARVNADGTLDTTFDPGTGADDWVFVAAFQPDGRAVIGGSFTAYDGVNRSAVARVDVTAYSLTVERDGTGTGTVSSDPAGIDCGADCTAYYHPGTVVQLTALPAAGSTFSGWSGDGCPDLDSCDVTMDQARTVTAAFELDTDSDGIGNAEEDAGPNSGDANEDGQLDSQQAEVATFRDVSGSWATLEAQPGLTLTDVTFMDPPADALREDLTYPRGFFGFTVQGLAAGGSTEVLLILHSQDPSINGFQKFGPTPDNAAAHLYDFSWDGGLGALIASQANQCRITLHLTDGAMGDSDLAANGRITDPGAPTQAGDGGGSGCFLDVLRR